jgi:hypothetical protein
MQFSHLIEINDLLNPLIDMLTREQLWNGLLRRARDPVRFVMSLDACAIVDDDGASLRRELRFGSLVVRDRVTFLPLESVTYEVEAGADFPASTLVMRIEEPEPEHLFVRFEYADSRPDTEASDREALEYLRSAYVAADIDTIRGIRELATEGEI